jgi:hypothetical protein
VHFLFKSSPFGTQSHGHNPHNSFQLNAYGEPLLVACTYRDLHGSKFHYQWVHSTVAQNGVLVDGEGQIKHSTAPHGKIVEATLSEGWDYVSGDATDAYAGRLRRGRRRSRTLWGCSPFLSRIVPDSARRKDEADRVSQARRPWPRGAGRKHIRRARDRRRVGARATLTTPG